MSGVRRINDDDSFLICLTSREIFPLYDLLVLGLAARRCPLLEELRDQIRGQMPPSLEQPG